MPFDGSGNYTPAAAPSFPAISGDPISSTYYNAVINDLATALSNCLTRDGQGKPSAAIDWNAKNLTNVAALASVTLAVSGASTLFSLAVTGPATVGTTLGVTGNIVGANLSGTNTGDQTSIVGITGTIAQFNTACTDADFASLAGAGTLTNKTIDLASNTLTGTLAQFNTALTGADFATLAGGETLTNKTLTSPTINTPTLTSPTINSAPVTTVSGTAPLSFVRAWCNYNGTGAIAIRASGNVSSLTDNGAGDHTLNFTTAMPDADYAAVGTGIVSGTPEVFASAPRGAGTMLAGSVRMLTKAFGSVATDCDIMCVIVAR